MSEIEKRQISVLELSSIRRFFSTPRYGSAVCSHLFLGAVAEFGKLTVASSDFSSSTKNDPYNAKCCFRGGLIRFLSPMSYLRTYILAKKIKPNIVSFTYPWLGWIGIAVARAQSIPAIYRSHNVEFLRMRDLGKFWWRLLFLYEQWVCRSSQLVLTVSRQDERIYKSVFKLSQKAVRTIPPSFIVEGKDAAGGVCSTRKKLLEEFGLSEDVRMYLFFGDLTYAPNMQALRNIVEEISVRLKRLAVDYRVFVCGLGLDTQTKNLLVRDDRIVYLGWVKDIGLYLRSVDAVINPVDVGGGIKIKTLEALSYGSSVVATNAGARGICRKQWKAQLKIVKNGDWDGFVRQLSIVRRADNESSLETYDDTVAAIKSCYLDLLVA